MLWWIKTYRKLKIWFSFDPIIIHVYYAYRYRSIVSIKGRVLQDKLIIDHRNDGIVRSFIKMIKRLMSDEKEDFPIEISLDALTVKTETDDEGYFEVDIENELSIHVVITGQFAMPTNYQITCIEEHADYGIISDIDDTLLITGVVSKFKWRVFSNSFFLNPWRRKSFENAQQLYHSLNKGLGGYSNPLFYVSNSPWNMYSYLFEFIRVNNFPQGFLILRDIGFSIFRRKEIEKKSKYQEIVKILDRCKDLKFVLIGDAGEIDTDIYVTLAQRFPKRIEMIYIRDVSKRKASERVMQLIEKAKPIRVVLFQHSNEVLTHARQNHLIRNIQE